MGVPYYFTYIIRQHRDVVKDHSAIRNVHNFYLDSNSIIYDELRTFDGDICESVFVQRILAKVWFYINEVSPTKRVFIAFDGVAPVAKLTQQRNRRYKSGFERALFVQHGLTKESSWDSAAITPGTRFMAELAEAVRREFSGKTATSGARIEVSTSEEAGEGEHKLFERIRSDPTHHRKTTTFIYGIDSDLIMLALNHSHASNYRLYLYRETPEFIKTIDSTLDPERNYVLDIPLLCSRVIDMMSSHVDNDHTRRNLLYDYILLCFFVGNDFVPKCPAVNIRNKGLQFLLSCYREAMSGIPSDGPTCLTDGTTIHWSNLRRLVTKMAEHEHTRFQEEHAFRSQKYEFREHEDTPQARFASIPMVKRESERIINPRKSGWPERYYRELFGECDVKAVCANYLESLEWTMMYYTSGCINWRWCYRYDYAPLLRDLANATPCFQANLVERSQQMPTTPLTLLAYVSPKASLLRLLPAALATKLLAEKPEWYVDNCRFRWAYCRYFWESHVVMNEIDLKELEDIVRPYEAVKESTNKTKSKPCSKQPARRKRAPPPFART
jgi:5'-3' exoribonuclease 1